MLERFLPVSQHENYEDFLQQYRIVIPEQFNFAYDIVDEYAATEPDKRALVWCDENGESRSFTFNDIKCYSDRIASHLAQLGIRKGDPVMLILRRRYEYWFCLIALMKLGAIAIPATHLLTKRDITYRNCAAEVKMIIAVDDERVMQNIDDAQATSPTLQLKVALRGTREGWFNLQDFLTDDAAVFSRPTGEEVTRNSDHMLVYFTSGTTGMPKMVLHDFTYPLGHILTAHYWQRVIDNGLHLTVADTGWAKAAWGKIYGQWICGSAVFVYDYDRFDAQQMLQVVTEHKVTTFCAPPTVFRYLIHEDLSRYDFSHLRYCAVAGEPLNPEVFQRFYQATGIKLTEGYGQTETTVIVGNYEWYEPRPGSMGKPSPGYVVELLNEQDMPCTVREEGQIVVRTDCGKPVGMFNGYYHDAELTNMVWHDGKYYTGDVAWQDEEGYYWFVGRADDLIKASGYRISPFEVESALLEHPSVIECAVTGAPDDVRGQVVKATVVLVNGCTPSDALAKELQEFVKEVTAPYKYPRIIEFVEQLPKTISGKIRRIELREKDTEVVA